MAMGEPALDATIARIVGAGDEEEAEEAEAEEEAKKASDEADVTVASLRSDLEDIKAAADADSHRDLIASLEARLAALEGGDEDEAEEAKKASDTVDRLAALNAGLARLAGEEKAEDEASEEAEEAKKASVVVAEEEEAEEAEAEEAKKASEDEAEESDEDEEGKKASEFTIELAAPEMDSLPGSSDLLDDIFTAHSKSAAEAPKRGVSKLGGGSKVAGSDGLGDLSNLWKSDPDVSGDFR
jgi:hypothetical protein